MKRDQIYTLSGLSLQACKYSIYVILRSTFLRFFTFFAAFAVDSGYACRCLGHVNVFTITSDIRRACEVGGTVLDLASSPSGRLATGDCVPEGKFKVEVLAEVFPDLLFAVFALSGRDQTKR